MVLAVIVTFLSCAARACAAPIKWPEASGTSAVITAVTVLASVGGAAINHGVIFSHSIIPSRTSVAYVVLLFSLKAFSKGMKNERSTVAHDASTRRSMQYITFTCRNRNLHNAASTQRCVLFRWRCITSLLVLRERRRLTLGVTVRCKNKLIKSPCVRSP